MSRVVGHRESSLQGTVQIDEHLGHGTGTWLDSVIRGHRFERGRADGELLKRLFDWRTLSNVLRHAQLEFPRLRIFKDGKCVPFWRYSEQGDDRRGPCFDLLRPLLESGATLSIRAAEGFSTHLGDLVAELSQGLRHDVSANLYACWGRAPGFERHWDDHDVLVLQVSGTKSWAVYGETNRWPVRQFHDHYASPPNQAEWAGVVTPGEVLWIPRGFWHSASGRGSPSLHLTIGFRRKNGLGWLSWVARHLAAVEDFRADLSGLTPEQLRERVDRLRQSCFMAMSPESAREYVAQERSARAEFAQDGTFA